MKLDRLSKDALVTLYKTWGIDRTGVPHSDLKIDRETIRYLYDEGLISAPESVFLTLNEEPLTYLFGSIYLTPKGRAIAEEALAESQEFTVYNNQETDNGPNSNIENNQRGVDGSKQSLKNNLKGFLLGVSTAVVAGLVLKYWESGIFFLRELIQSIVSFF